MTRPQDVVHDYLRGQNLEQVERVDEAIDCYERAVSSSFDAAGPYDRLIAIYSERAEHAEVARVAQAALDAVKTFRDKRLFYRETLQRAEEAAEAQPDPTGPEF